MQADLRRAAERWAGVGVPLCAALAINFAVLVFAPALELMGDSKKYWELGETLARGDAYWGVWAPGYPLFVALHSTPALVKLTQILLSGVSLVLVFRLCCDAFGRPAATIAAWIFALEPTLIFFANNLYAETLFICLFLAFTYLYLRLLDSPKASLGVAALAGLLLGGAILTKPVIVYFGLAALGVMAWRRRVPATIMALAMAATLAPWCIRNYFTYGDPLQLELAMGQNLAFGNSDMRPANWDYGYPKPARTSYLVCLTNVPDPTEKIAECNRAHPACRVTNRAEADACNLHNALAYMTAHPGQVVSRIPVKLADLWSPTSFVVRDLQRKEFSQTPPGIVIGACVLAVGEFMFVVVASILGMLLLVPDVADNRQRLLRRYAVALVAYYCAAYSLFFATSRFRLPLTPFLIIFCAAAIVRRRDILRSLTTTWRGRAAILGVLAMAALWSTRIATLFGPP